MKNASESLNGAETELPNDMFGNPEDIGYEMSNDDPDDDKDEDEDEEESANWGDVDPTHDPRQPAGPMDPSGPGSAV
ncbi:MAG: hypothetical protein EOO50_15415 [Flavobacterium sp.]|uniref:hypothetical protein n=1 Tax=Flavobacterium sp. TaxID=239 RepID=UPI001201D49D|nr:hypothetical protein [Flavobacterium sp.]RZJ64510.1 MAG: hypothetical protein EOO50_15415 [Flavobacterium sp.]